MGVDYETPTRTPHNTHGDGVCDTPMDTSVKIEVHSQDRKNACRVTEQSGLHINSRLFFGVFQLLFMKSSRVLPETQFVTTVFNTVF